ncbi:MAG: acyltransferase family protein [Gammaproteobacteria bacterium]
MPSIQPYSAPARRHDVDALRVIAFGLLIIFHVGMFYVADWGWHIKSNYQFEWLQLPMLVLNQWRMSLIFLISGLAVSFAWGKYHPGLFALRRFSRLFVPLLFGMAVVVAPQNYYEALSNGAIQRGFVDFFSTYLAGGEFPANAYDDAETPMWTWNHLWYLPYLLGYTLVLIPFALFLRGPGIKVLENIRRVRGIWLILLPLVPLILYGNLIFPKFPYINHGLTDDWYAHAMYFTFFAYGFLIGNDDELWNQLRGMRKYTLPAAVISFASFYTLSIVLPENSFSGHSQLALVVIYLNRWLWIVALLGWGRHLLNKPFRWLPYATVAVYPWYILHQTITVVAGYELSQLERGPIVEPILVLASTILGCLLLHEFVVRRSGVLRYLFGVPIARRK